MAAIENNMFSFGIVANEHGGSDNEDRIEVMGAQTRAWTQHGPLIDVMGRYEARLARQLLKYQQEFERLQAVRKRQERIDEDRFDPASFLQNSKDPNAWRLLSYLKPPKGWKKPDEIADQVAEIAAKPDEITETAHEVTEKEPDIEKQAA
ncbi:MAG TPA: hypothetical protein VHY84_08530 [Bryobacteraceae bacterium]|jgi:hypothetical protein|nr:hypothetical protein [Bryobacteraceae bacterium]